MQNNGNSLAVGLAFETGARTEVCRLGLASGAAYMEFDEAFIDSKMRINPLVAPASGIVSVPKHAFFFGLPGVVADSLPDAWGELLLRRYAASQDIPYNALTAIYRLAMIGVEGPGALAYQPAWPSTSIIGRDALDLSALSKASFDLLDGSDIEHIDQLYELAGSSGGACPKISVVLETSGIVRSARLAAGHDDTWLVKFRGPSEPPDAGLLEAAYADMARTAGITISPTRVLPARRGPGYFATRRFDRLRGNMRLHVASVAGILEVDWTIPSIDYDQLLSLTRKVAGQADLEQMFRRMVFNVAAHNRDDHTKQHAFLMDATGAWRLAPAYDLTFSRGPGGEHYLSIGGQGRDIARDDVLKVAASQMIDRKRAVGIIDEVQTSVAAFPAVAKSYGVSKPTARLVTSAIRLGLRG